MNWIRCQVPPIERAIALASEVLPTPGTSSISRWPCGEQADERELDRLALALDVGPQIVHVGEKVDHGSGGIVLSRARKGSQWLA